MDFDLSDLTGLADTGNKRKGRPSLKPKPKPRASSAAAPVPATAGEELPGRLTQSNAQDLASASVSATPSVAARHPRLPSAPNAPAPAKAPPPTFAASAPITQAASQAPPQDPLNVEHSARSGSDSVTAVLTSAPETERNLPTASRQPSEPKAPAAERPGIEPARSTAHATHTAAENVPQPLATSHSQAGPQSSAPLPGKQGSTEANADADASNAKPSASAAAAADAAPAAAPAAPLDDVLGLGALTSSTVRARRLAPGMARPRAKPRPSTTQPVEPSQPAPDAPASDSQAQGAAVAASTVSNQAQAPRTEPSVTAEVQAAASAPQPETQALPASQPVPIAPDHTCAPAAPAAAPAALSAEAEHLRNLPAATNALLSVLASSEAAMQAAPEPPQLPPPAELLAAPEQLADDSELASAKPPRQPAAPRAKARHAPSVPRPRKSRKTAKASAVEAAEGDESPAWNPDEEAENARDESPQRKKPRKPRKPKAQADSQQGSGRAKPKTQRKRRSKQDTSLIGDLADLALPDGADDPHALSVVPYVAQEDEDAADPDKQVVKTRQDKAPADPVMAELCPWRKKKADAVDLAKEVTTDMTLEHVIRRATLQTRQLDQAAKKRAGAAAKAPGASKPEQQTALVPRNDVDEPQPPAGFVLAPQVKMVNGKLQVDESSLRVQATQQEQMSLITDDDDNQPMNSLSFLPLSKLTKDRWTAEESDTFYKALSQFGTDFSLISEMFPARTRKQIKNKYLKEQRVNPARMDQALSGRDRDMAQFRHMAALLKTPTTTEKGADAADGKAGVGALEGAAPQVPAAAGAQKDVHYDEEDDDADNYMY